MKIAKYGGCYSPFNERSNFIKAISEVEDMKPEFVADYAEASGPLCRRVLIFTSPTKSIALPDPGHKSGVGTAKFVDVQTTRVRCRRVLTRTM